MKKITTTLGGVALGGCLLASAAQAASIQSMTIEDLYGTPGWIGNYSQNGGTFQYFTPDCCFRMLPENFVTAGSHDGAILMGIPQGNGGFTNAPIFIYNLSLQLNTMNGAPRGSISGHVMTLDLSGLSGEGRDYLGNTIYLDFSPDPLELSTVVQRIDDTHYYYTADWTHRALSEADSAAGFADYTWVFHLEGVATLAPVPEPETYALMLAGLGLVGAAARHRRTA